MSCQNQRARRQGFMAWLAAVLCGALGFAAGASAGPIGPGTDLLKAQLNTHWDFSSSPIPADFFGPGSDPFGGEVATVTMTRVVRPGGADFPGGQQTVPAEMVSLNLHSTDPIEVTFGVGQQSKLFDVFITLDTRPSLPPDANTGQYKLFHNPSGQPDGGTVSDISASYFDVYFDLQFTDAATGAGDLHLYRRQHLGLTAPVPWAHTAPPLYLRPGSDFYPGVDPRSPTEGEPMTMVYEGSEFTWRVRLAAIPEPATGALAGLALAGLGAYVRRRRKA